MSQLGERLRAAREEQGITIGQAAVETRILQRYLVALEDGDYQHLPGDVYARGFIRNYAAYLGLPAEEVVELYRRERGASEPIRVVPATSSPRIRGFFIPSFFGVFFVVLLLIAASYLVLSATNNIGESSLAVAEPTPAIATPTRLPTPRPAATDSSVLAIGPTVSPTAEAIAGGVQATPLPTVTPSGAPIVVEVRIQDGENPGSWLRVDRDGETLLQRVLRPGESYRVEAQRNVTMKAGNAGVVYVTVNGQQLQGPLGAPGQVITFVWPQQ